MRLLSVADDVEPQEAMPLLAEACFNAIAHLITSHEIKTYGMREKMNSSSLEWAHSSQWTGPDSRHKS